MTKLKTHHKQVQVSGRRPDGKYFSFSCDEKIAGLLKEINEAGVETVFSCQDWQKDKTNALQILFKHEVSKEDLKKAADIITRRYPRRLVCMTQNAYFDPILVAVSEKNLSKLSFSLWCIKYDKNEKHSKCVICSKELVMSDASSKLWDSAWPLSPAN